MALIYSPNITNEGLILGLDAESVRSYSGTGTNWTDLSPKKYPNVDMNNMSAASNYVAATSSSPAYFEFVNNANDEYFEPGLDAIGTDGVTPKQGTFELWFYMTGEGRVFGVSKSYSEELSPEFAVSIGSHNYANWNAPSFDRVDVPMYLAGPRNFDFVDRFNPTYSRPGNDVYYNEDGTMVPYNSFGTTESSVETAILATGRNFQPLLNQWVHLAITYEAGTTIDWFNNVDGPGSNEYGMMGGPPTIWYINGKKRFKCYDAEPTWDLSNSTNSFRIGNSQQHAGTGAGSNTVTRISQFRMYNRILSESEVSSNYNALKKRYGH